MQYWRYVFSLPHDLTTPRIVATQSKLSSGTFGDHSHCDSGYNGFILSRDLRGPRNQRDVILWVVDYHGESPPYQF